MHVDGGFSLRAIRKIGIRMLVVVALIAGFVGAVTSVPALAIGPNAIRTFAGTSTLAATDDGSTAAVPLGFPINYYGAQYSSVYVNNNGNLTFDGPLGTYTPSGLVGPATRIIAPFFADVDTRAPGSHLVTYGQGTVDGHAAFAVTWPGVGCYEANNSVLDYFQVVIIDRSDTGSENFDIEFNYDQIQWDAGEASGGNQQCTGSTAAAHAGYSNGVASDSYELPGSGVNGAFLDGGPDALASHSANSSQLGRYLFSIRTVATTTTGTLADGTNIGATLQTTVGTPVTDSAVLSGQTATASGTMTYAVYTNADCSGSPTATSVKAVSNGAAAASDPFSLPRGAYRVVAAYSGDSHNRSSDTACGDQLLTVNPRPLTITAQDRSITYGGVDPAFGYTVTGLVGADQLISAPTCGVTGAHATVGTYAITCSGADAGSDYAITYQPGTLSVGQAVIHISADNESTEYGAGDPEFSYEVSGLLGSDQLTTPPTCGVAGNHSDAGAYPISCSGADAGGNYHISYSGATLTVGPAPLTITANDTSRVYGTADPVFSYTVHGLVGSDTLTTAPACAVTGAHDNVGNYAIDCTGAEASHNYTIGYLPGTLTVEKATATITPDSKSIVYGDPDPAFTYTTAGLVDGDTLTQAATCAVTDPHVHKGAYAITCSGAAAGDNYRVEYGSGTLTVTAAPGAITPDPQSITYGDPEPTFTYSVSGLRNGDQLTTPPTCGVEGEHAVAGTYTITCSGADAGSDYVLDESATATLTVVPKQITVAADNQGTTYGAGDPAFTSTVTGLAGADRLITPATCGVEGAHRGAGTYTITCSGADAGSNYMIRYASGTYTVAKAHLTVNAPSPTTTYGIAASTITFAPSFNGLVYDDTPTAAGVAEVTCGTTAEISAGGSYPAGTYPVTCVGPGTTANYTVSYEAGALAVSKARLTFTAESLTREYGTANPPLIATASGLVNGDTAAAAYSGEPAVSTAATPTSDTGSYPITVSVGTLSSANYTFAFVTGTLTITAAPTVLDAQSVPVGIGPGGLRLQVGSLSATLRTGSGNVPVAGQPVVFSVGSTRLCTANTDTHGVATCAINLVQQLQVVLNLGFTASFPGSRNYLPSMGRAGLIGPL